MVTRSTQHDCIFQPFLSSRLRLSRVEFVQHLLIQMKILGLGLVIINGGLYTWVRREKNINGEWEIES